MSDTLSADQRRHLASIRKMLTSRDSIPQAFELLFGLGDPALEQLFADSAAVDAGGAIRTGGEVLARAYADDRIIAALASRAGPSRASRVSRRSGLYTSTA